MLISVEQRTPIVDYRFTDNEKAAFDAFIKSDRQWPRHCRLLHARRRLAIAMKQNETEFWQRVIKAIQL